MLNKSATKDPTIWLIRCLCFPGNKVQNGRIDLEGNQTSMSQQSPDPIVLGKLRKASWWKSKAPGVIPPPFPSSHHQNKTQRRDILFFIGHLGQSSVFSGGNKHTEWKMTFENLDEDLEALHHQPELSHLRWNLKFPRKAKQWLCGQKTGAGNMCCFSWSITPHTLVSRWLHSCVLVFTTAIIRPNLYNVKIGSSLPLIILLARSCLLSKSNLRVVHLALQGSNN